MSDGLLAIISAAMWFVAGLIVGRGLTVVRGEQNVGKSNGQGGHDNFD